MQIKTLLLFRRILWAYGEFLKSLVNLFGVVNKTEIYQSDIIRKINGITIDHSIESAGACLE